MPQTLTVGEFEIHIHERRLLRAGQPQPLGARALDLLLALARHRDRVVGKQELMALVWPGLVVEDNNLTVQMSALRKLLGAGCIATVPGRGYRLTADVGEAPPADVPTPVPAATAPPGLFGRAEDLAALRQAVLAHGLVTLLGTPSGCGWPARSSRRSSARISNSPTVSVMGMPSPRRCGRFSSLTLGASAARFSNA